MTSSRPPGVLRVASYNVRDLKDDAAAAARVVRAIGPDVLCLQEVPRHLLSGHRVGDFANACGLLFAGGHQGSGGTTVLTSLRAEVPSTTHHRLAVRRLQRTRGYAVAQVALPGHLPLHILSAHLSLSSTERVRHVEAILAHLRSLDPASWAAGPQRLVLGADLNESSDGQAWRALAAVLAPVTGPAPTFPARAPRRRIDAVFASPDLRPLDATQPAAPDLAQFDLAQSDLVAATDHLPVWVDLELTAVR